MGMDFNVNAKAGRIDRQRPYVRAAAEEIVRRAHLVGTGAAIEQLVRAELEKRLDEWLARAQQMTSGQRLGYRDVRDGVTVPVIAPERRAPISRTPPTWLPAAEVRGEGLFLQLGEDGWLIQSGVLSPVTA
jgi:hypothetical protein